MIPFFKVRGFSKMVMGKKQYLFSGIPYAKPPVGNRRFDDDNDDHDDHDGFFFIKFMMIVMRIIG